MVDAGDIGGMCHMSPQLLQMLFLVAKVGDILLVGGLGEQREVGGSVAEILAKTSHESGEEEGVGDRKIQVTELVGEGLEVQAVGVEEEVILAKTEELLLEEGDALELVVGEEASDLVP
jgi:hypothetical protein